MTDCKTISELLRASRSRSVPLGASQSFSELSHVLSPVLIHLATKRLPDSKTASVLSEAASSKMLNIDFARQNKYFQRSANSLNCFCSTKQVLPALCYSQTSRKLTFERWLFSLDETRSSSAFSFSGTTNTMVSAPWCISLYKI